MSRIDSIAKAIIAATIAGLSAIMGALTAGDGTWASVDAEAWVGAAIAFLTALTAVYFIPNGERPPAQEPMFIGFDEGDPWDSSVALEAGAAEGVPLEDGGPR